MIPDARTRRPARPLRVFAALLVAWSAVAVVPATAAQPTRCGPGGTVEKVGNGWLMSHPAFPAGPADVTLVAAPAFDPNLIYVSNGVSLMRSNDAGCGWKTVYQAGPNALQGTGAITALAVPSSANNSSYVYLGVTHTVAAVDTPSILVSDDYGEEWSTASNGLPDIGRVREIAASPQVQMVAFAVIDVAISTVLARSALYSTSDAGEMWTQRTGTTQSFTPHGLVVDPVRQAALYGLDGTRVVKSLDNAESFAPTDGDPGPVNELASAPGAGSIRLAGTRGDGTGVARSDDGGRSWRTVATPAVPRDVAMAPLQDVVAVSSGAEAWLIAGPTTVPITPDEGGAPLQMAVTAPTPLGYAVSGIASGALVRATFALGTTDPIDPPGITPVLLLPVRPISQFPSVLVPPRLSVRLAAGESRTVPYTLLLPRTPTPVDVMFLLDSTGSYQPVIDGLRQALARIVNALGTAGLDARFGAGHFQDYPPPYGIAANGNVPYELDRRIGPGDEELADALEDIDANGGTSDGGQSSLTAIYQAITGAGEVIRGHRVIDRGLDARFRQHALKIVMTSTDTEPHYKGQEFSSGDGTIVQPGPSYDDVIKALRSHGVLSVGIPNASDTGGPSAYEPLRRLARASNALAPLGGVDCDGNGRIDLPTAAPLVCSITSGGTGLAAAIVGLVAGISDREAVTLRITKGRERARLLSAPVRTVDLHADNELAHAVRLTCPKAAAKTYDIALQASTPIRSLAGGVITLACGGLPGTPPEIFEDSAPLPPRAAAAQGITDISVSVQTNPNTNPQPNSNPQPQPLANFQTGIAVNQEQQFQLALVADELFKPGSAEEYAMSDRRATLPDPAFGAAAAALAMAAGSVALRRRRRTAVALSRVRATCR